MTVSVHVDVDEGAFRASLPGAFEEWKVEALASIDDVADKVVSRARELVAKRTGRLVETIVRGPLVVTPGGGYIQIAAGDGTRYAIYQEFGTSKMAAHPFVRPALAMAAGGLRSLGFAARMATTSRTRAAVRREIHRQKLRRAVHAGLLTSREAGLESRRVSRIRGFKG